jgi:hypothetical protein
MDVNVWENTTPACPMGSYHAIDDLAGANLGIETVAYGFYRVLLSIPPQPRLDSVLAYALSSALAVPSLSVGLGGTVETRRA